MQKLNVYVSHDCTGITEIILYSFMYCIVYSRDVQDIFESDQDQSLLVMIPVRLGSEALNPIYIPCVKVSYILLQFNILSYTVVLVITNTRS